MMLQALTVGKGRIPRDDLCRQHANFTYTAPNQNRLPSVFAIRHTGHCTCCHSDCCLFLQKEEERLRASIRRESQQRRMREKQHQRGLSSSYLEPDRYDDEDEGEEAISLAAIKSKYKGGGGLRGEIKKLFLRAHELNNCINIFYLFLLMQRSGRGSTHQTVMKAQMMTRLRG